MDDPSLSPRPDARSQLRIAQGVCVAGAVLAALGWWLPWLRISSDYLWWYSGWAMLDAHDLWWSAAVLLSYGLVAAAAVWLLPQEGGTLSLTALLALLSALASLVLVAVGVADIVSRSELFRVDWNLGLPMLLVGLALMVWGAWGGWQAQAIAALHAAPPPR